MRTYILLTAFFAGIVLCAFYRGAATGQDGAPAGFVITGDVAGSPEGMKLYLRYADQPLKGRVNLDSVLVHNGKFIFRGSTTSPRFYEILFRDAKAHPGYTFEDKNIQLFVENAPITVKAVYDSLPIEYEGWAALKPGVVTISGSKPHEALLAYDRGERPLSEVRGDLFDKYIKTINAKGDDMESKYRKGVPVTLEMDAADAALMDYNMKYVLGHAPDAVNALVALRVMKYPFIRSGQVDTLIRHFAGAGDKGFLVDYFLSEAPGYQRTAVGASVIDMKLTDSAGRTYRLSDYIGNGKYVMLECWASWCGPCRADIPHLKAMYKDYHPEGFEIISVSLDDKRERWVKALNEEHMPWLQLSDLHAFDGGLPKAYHINGIPHCLLFDPKGNLVTTNMRGSWMDRRLAEMYGDHSVR